MTCDEADILLHALIDGELDAGHAREVENHIATCARCTVALKAYREMKAAIAAADVHFTAPAHLRQRIEAAMPQSRRHQPSLTARRLRHGLGGLCDSCDRHRRHRAAR